MQDVMHKIQESMEYLHLRESDLKLLTLLPMAYVAWADGDVHDKELKVILQTATDAGLVDGRSGEVLASWLHHKPTEEFWRHGLYLIGVMLQRQTEEERGDILELAEKVGRAAGGLFHVAFSLSAAEREALGVIRATLGVHNKDAHKQVKQAVRSRFSTEELGWH